MRTRVLLRFLSLLYFLNFSAMEAVISWQLPAIAISEEGNDAGSPQISIDGNGNAVAVWARFNGINYIIQGATFNSKASPPQWSSPVEISERGQNADAPQISINKAGQAVAVWARFDGDHYVIQAATTQTQPTATNVWSSPVDLSKGAKDAQCPQIGVDSNGNAVAIWVKNSMDTPTATFIEGALFTQNTWSSPDPVSHVGESAMTPQIAVNPAGRAVAVWRSCNVQNGLIYGATFTPNNGWQQAIKLSNSGQASSIPQVGIDNNGNAIAVWRRSNGSNFIIQASTLLNGAWSTPINLSDEGFDGDEPQIAVGAKGGAIACWSLQVDLSTSLIQSSQSNTNTPNQWSSPNDFTSDQEAYSPNLAINPPDSTLIWSIAGCTLQSSIQANSTVIPSFKLNQNQVLFGPTNPADESKIAISSNDNDIVAVWRGFDGIHNRIWAVIGTFAPPFSTPPREEILPPQKLSVKQVENRFATQADLINIVKWSASPTSGVTSYHLFRNDKLIATLSADQKRVFKDHNRKEGVRTVYSVTALIGKEESEPTKIIFKK